jgi:hypothetical protein
MKKLWRTMNVSKRTGVLGSGENAGLVRLGAELLERGGRRSGSRRQLAAVVGSSNFIFCVGSKMVGGICREMKRFGIWYGALRQEFGTLRACTRMAGKLQRHGLHEQ